MYGKYMRGVYDRENEITSPVPKPKGDIYIVGRRKKQYVEYNKIKCMR